MGNNSLDEKYLETSNVKLSKYIESDIRQGNISEETLELIKKSINLLLINPAESNISVKELLEIDVLSKKIFDIKYPSGQDNEGYTYKESISRHKMLQSKAETLINESQKHGTGLVGNTIYPEINLKDILSNIQKSIENSKIDKQELSDKFEADLITNLGNGFFNVGNVILYDKNTGGFYSILDSNEGKPFKLQGIKNGGPIYLYVDGEILTQDNSNMDIFLNNSGNQFLLSIDTLYKIAKIYESNYIVLENDDNIYLYGGKRELYIENPIQIDKNNYFNGNLFYGFESSNNEDHIVINLKKGNRLLINLDNGDSKLYQNKEYIPGSTTLHDYSYDQKKGMLVTKEQGEITQFNKAGNNEYITNGEIMTNLKVDLGEYVEQLKDINIFAIKNKTGPYLVFSSKYGDIKINSYNNRVLTKDNSLTIRIKNVYNTDDFLNIEYEVVTKRGFFKGTTKFFQQIFINNKPDFTK